MVGRKLNLKFLVINLYPFARLKVAYINELWTFLSLKNGPPAGMDP